ncbi:hypothetical protein M0802_006943 [Mischocyttarus mexicanus]|nr:hypothetical protein M0802_006943 [Mischocyttarus mexicanus]
MVLKALIQNKVEWRCYRHFRAVQLVQQNSTLSHKFCEKCQSDIKQCEENDESGEQQKKKIKLESDPNVSNPAVDDSVNSSESDEDKDKTDAKNTLPSDLKITEEKLHQLSTQNEALKQLYIKSQLALCHEKLLALEDIPKECTSLETMSSQFLDYEQSCHCTKKFIS